MGAWRVESLWGMRGMHSLKTGLATGRSPRTLNSLQSAAQDTPGLVDAKKVEQALARDRHRFLQQERAILRLQARMLAAREELKTALMTNLAIQAGRRMLMQERVERVEHARETARLSRQSAIAGRRRKEG